jgi:hypothetical protein
VNRQVCMRCIVDSRVPDVTFNAEGLCNHCQTYLEQAEPPAIASAAQGEAKFLKLFKSGRGRSDYDCLCLFSGGKDSTAMLYHMAVRLKLKVLAFTLDNGFLSPEAHRNIERVTKHLGVDHVYAKPEWDLMSHLFQTAILQSDRSLKSRRLAFMIGHICWPCFAMVSLFSVMTAVERGIPRIIVSTTPGQQRQKNQNLRRKFGGVLDVYLSMIRPLLLAIDPAYRARLRMSVMDRLRALLGVRVIPFHDYFIYDENEAFRTAKEHCAWKQPEDTDACSTNCLANALGIAIHKSRYGISPYLIPMGYDVRKGLVDRDDALRALEAPLDLARVQAIAEKLGVSPDAYRCPDSVWAKLAPEPILLEPEAV